MTHGGREVIEPELFHQRADAAAGEAGLIAAAVGVFVKVHVPGIGVAVGSLQRFCLPHGCKVLRAEFVLTALAAEPAHGLRHHGVGIESRQRLHLRALRHAEHERAEHRAVDLVHLEPIGCFEFRQLRDDLPVARLRRLGDPARLVGVIAEHRAQLRPERAGKQAPHPHGHPEILHPAFLHNDS